MVDLGWMCKGNLINCYWKHGGPDFYLPPIVSRDYPNEG